MLTPSGNLQDWINNQNKQVRAESDVKIEIFSVNSSGVVSLVGTINKANLESFNMTESGSVLGFSNWNTNINFTFFKNGTIENYFDIGRLIRISYGYLINSSWSWVEKGVYEISKVKVQNNGLVGQCEARMLRYQALEQEWSYGGAGCNFSTWFSLLCNELQKYDSYLLVPSPTGAGVEMGFGSFSSKSILGTLVSLGQANGYSLKLKGFINIHNRYGLDIDFLRLRTSNLPNLDYIIQYGNELKKYEIVDEQYYDGVSIWETWAVKDNNGYLQPLSATISISGFEAKKSKVSVSYNDKYPYQYYNFIDTPSSGSLGDDASIKIFGNEIMCNCPTSTVPDDGTVSISYPYVKISKELHSGGDNSIEIDNPFVSCQSWNDNISGASHLLYDNFRDFMEDWGQRHIELEVRFDPRIELLDNIIYADNQNNFRNGVVEEYTLNFNGAFKGKIIVRDVDDYNQYTATFYDTDETTVVSQEILWKGYTPTIPDYTPQKYAINNAVYVSFTFSGWSPTVAPITQDTDYYPTFSATYRQYSVINYSSMPNSWRGQIAYYSTVSGAGNMYVHTPHIANIHALGSSGSPTIPSATGKSVISISSTKPTSFQGNENNDDWQDNYYYFKYNTNDNKWYYVSSTGTGLTVRYLCKGQNGYYWFADFRTQTQNNLTPIAFSTLDEWWQALEYDDVNDCFRISEEYGGQSCEIYYETT